LHRLRREVFFKQSAKAARIYIITHTADKESEELKVTMNAIAKATEANAKAIADLTIEVKVGFANVDTKLAKLEVFDERTKELDRR
jgi:hypothetical protein